MLLNSVISPLRMAYECYPYLYLNLGCEMMYIIDQRLKAQNICRIKSQKVINDLIMALFNPVLINKIFEKQPSPSKVELKQLLMELAHSSIMKLNEQSMDKLFNLMLMVNKYQLVMCRNPSEFVVVTGNHLTSLRKMTNSNACCGLIDSTKSLFDCTFQNETPFKLHLIRSVLLNYFGGSKIKVSALMMINVQNNEGNFVLSNNHIVDCKCNKPGTIKHYDSNAEATLVEFNSGGVYEKSKIPSQLGMNIYINDDDQESLQSNLGSVNETLGPFKETPNEGTDCDSKIQQRVKKETELLANLIGRPELETLAINVLVDLDADLEDKLKPNQEEGISIAGVKWNLDSIKKEFEIESEAISGDEQTNDVDLLAIIDS